METIYLEEFIMKLINKIKLSIARRALKESHDFALKYYDLMCCDILKGNVIEPSDGRLLYREYIRRIMRRLKIVKLCGGDTTIIYVDIELVNGTYKNWYQNYSYKG